MGSRAEEGRRTHLKRSSLFLIWSLVKLSCPTSSQVGLGNECSFAPAFPEGSKVLGKGWPLSSLPVIHSVACLSFQVPGIDSHVEQEQ